MGKKLDETEEELNSSNEKLAPDEHGEHVKYT